MRPNYYGTATLAAHAFTTLPAQSINAVAVHFPSPVMTGGRMLPAGNYTISSLRGEVPILRFQRESGEAIAVMVTREYLPMDDASPQSEVMVAGDDDNSLRVMKVAMEGDPFVFVVADLS